MASPKKPAASAAAAASAPHVDSLVEAAPFVETAPVAETAAEVEAAPVLDLAPVVASSPVPALEAVEAKAVAPFADVAKLMEAPMASITEAQGKVRSIVDAGITETHSKFAKMKSAADEAAQAIETSYATVKNGAVQLNVKALELVSATAAANFDFFKSVFAVKSPSDYVMLQSEFARKQIEMATAHTKAFGELAQKVVVDTVEPIKAQVAKTFQIN